MKGGFFRLIGAAMTALICVGMWGCGDLLREDGEKDLQDIILREMQKLLGL